MNRFIPFLTHNFVTIVISGVMAFFVYEVVRPRADALPRASDSLKAMSPPDTAATAAFKDRMANGGWIDRPFRELTDLLGPGRESSYSCDGTKGFNWLLSKRSVEDSADPAGTLVVEVVSASANGFGIVDTGESKITWMDVKEYRYRN